MNIFLYKERIRLTCDALLILILACRLASGQQTTLAATGEDQFSQLLNQFQNNPTDNGLRWRIIMLAKARAAMGFPAPVPAEAKQSAAEGDYLFQNAQDQGGYQQAADAYEQSLKIAPWQTAPYYNYAKASEKLKFPTQAVQSMHWFLLAVSDDDSKDKTIGRALIGQIEGEARETGVGVDESEWTPLVWAARWGDWPTVHSLTGSGGNVSEKDSNNNFPLDYAMQQDNPNELDYLLAHGANEFKYNDVKLLQFVAERGKDLNDFSVYYEPSSKDQPDDWSLLAAANYDHQPAIAQLLGENGAKLHPCPSLIVKGISEVSGNRYAIINNHTFSAGDQGDVITSEGRIHIRCVEVGDDSVVIECAGTQHVLKISNQP